MDGEEGGGFKFGKKSTEGEVDYRTKSGTAWSHNFLNQKPWHPLSYPNQRRKWIAEQTHAEKHRRTEEVAREYAQEQEFFRQTAVISKKEKEKLEMMKAVSFMYVKPPGYNAESAKAAEVADEQKMAPQEPSLDEASASKDMETLPSVPEKKKPRLKDIYGRALPTEEQFEVLKNAPRLETGIAARAKPFGVEIRNVKCLRCGKYGHQSGDRECPLKDAIMPNEENRLKRDDPLTAIQAQTESSEPLKWELKQKPGMSPPRGGFDADDPNQQIVAEEIFDEYGGFLDEAIIPELLTHFSSSKSKKKSEKKKKHRKKSLRSTSEASDDEGGPPSSDDDERRRLKKKCKRKKHKHYESNSSESSEDTRRRKKSNIRKHHRSEASDEESGPAFRDDDERRRLKKQSKRKTHKHSESNSSESSEDTRLRRKKSNIRKHHRSEASDEESGPSSSDDDERRRPKKQSNRKTHKHSESNSLESSEDTRHRHKKSNIGGKHHRSHISEDSDSDERRRKHRHHRHSYHRRHRHGSE